MGYVCFRPGRVPRFGVFYYINGYMDSIVFEVDILCLFPVAGIYRCWVVLVGFGEILFSVKEL